MTDCVAGHSPSSRLMLSRRATIVLAVLAAMIFSASGAAPTPLYQSYQASLGLTTAATVAVFAAYPLSLLLALLVVGGLSDHVGRRPAIIAALALNMAAMGIFLAAGSAAALIAARAVQGLATGLATTTLGATIVDLDAGRGPTLNSVTAFAGLTVGSLGAGALVSFAPFPQQLVYVVLAGLSAAATALLWFMPETTKAKSGVLASLRPRVGVPVQARSALAQVTPVNVAAWALGGFYFSLMPGVVRAATGLAVPIIGGAVVATLTLAAAVAVLCSRAVAARRAFGGGILVLMLGVASTLFGMDRQSVVTMMLGTAVSGLGFGTVFSAAMRSVLPLAGADERAGLLAAFYVEGYLAFALPAVTAGIAAPLVGLVSAAEIYGAAVVALAAFSLALLVHTRANR